MGAESPTGQLKPPRVTRRTYTSPAADKLAAKGEDWLIEQLENGRSYREVAKDLGISTMSVYNWAHERDGILSARAHKAAELGAEAHEALALKALDDARREIEEHPELAGSITMLARERSQAHWRLASIRDRSRYGDTRRQQVDVTVRHHQVESLPTPELERLVEQARQTLTLEGDGTVTGGTSDSGDRGE